MISSASRRALAASAAADCARPKLGCVGGFCREGKGTGSYGLAIFAACAAQMGTPPPRAAATRCTGGVKATLLSLGFLASLVITRPCPSRDGAIKPPPRLGVGLVGGSGLVGTPSPPDGYGAGLDLGGESLTPPPAIFEFGSVILLAIREPGLRCMTV